MEITTTGIVVADLKKIIAVPAAGVAGQVLRQWAEGQTAIRIIAAVTEVVKEEAAPEGLPEVTEAVMPAAVQQAAGAILLPGEVHRPAVAKPAAVRAHPAPAKKAILLPANGEVVNLSKAKQGVSPVWLHYSSN